MAVDPKQRQQISNPVARPVAKFEPHIGNGVSENGYRQIPPEDLLRIYYPHSR